MSEPFSEPGHGIVEGPPAGGFEAKRDGLGLALFTAGSFFAVLLALALGSDEPLAQARGTGALARAWSGSFGLIPGLVFCAGIAALGARTFLIGVDRNLRRNAGGLALTALGVSALLGAFSATAGGLAGDLTTGFVGRFTHPILGALTGLAVFLVPVWVVWLRPGLAAPHPGDLATEPPPSERPSGRVPLPDEGVSAAEAAALIPEYPPPSLADRRKQPQHAPAAASLSPSVAAPVVASPYREDVRLRGEIPEGARPLDSTHAHSPIATVPALPSRRDDPAVPALRERPPAHERALPELAAGEDLAGAAGPEPALELPSAIAPRRAEPAAGHELSDEYVEILLDGLLGAEPQEQGAAQEAGEDEREEELDEEVDFDAAELEEVVEEEPSVAAELADPDPLPDGDELVPMPPPELARPSWEQPSLFEVAEEPVDSYGTPISTIEAVRAEAPLVDESSLAANVPEEAEREVELKPVKKRPKAKAAERATAEDRGRLLAEIGCLLVDRGRVAVSMLQKQYGMDFDEATRVLDELQSMGLIGPYLGGKRRDILLTRDEWLEKVSSL